MRAAPVRAVLVVYNPLLLYLFRWRWRCCTILWRWVSFVCVKLGSNKRPFATRTHLVAFDPPKTHRSLVRPWWNPMLNISTIKWKILCLVVNSHQNDTKNRHTILTPINAHTTFYFFLVIVHLVWSATMLHLCDSTHIINKINRISHVVIKIERSLSHWIACIIVIVIVNVAVCDWKCFINRPNPCTLVVRVHRIVVHIQFDCCTNRTPNQRKNIGAKRRRNRDSRKSKYMRTMSAIEWNGERKNRMKWNEGNTKCIPWSPNPF